jgi:hypothetical protein
MTTEQLSADAAPRNEAVAPDERAAFEAWAKTKKMDLTPFGATFDSDFTSNAWDGWQARAAAPVVPATDAAPAMHAGGGEPVAYTSLERLKKIAERPNHVDTMWAKAMCVEGEGDIPLYTTTPATRTAADAVQGEPAKSQAELDAAAYLEVKAALWDEVRQICVPHGAGIDKPITEWLADRLATPAASLVASAGEPVTDERLTELAVDHLHIDYDRMPAGVVPLLRGSMALSHPPIGSNERARLTESVIRDGWHNTFSTENPFCPCDFNTFTKAVRWAEHAIKQQGRGNGN